MQRGSWVTEAHLSVLLDAGRLNTLGMQEIGQKNP